MSARLGRLRLATPLLALVLLPSGATATVAGCGGGADPGGGATPRACTEIGCNDGVGFVLARGALRSDGPVVARACVDGKCTMQRFDPSAFRQAGGVRIHAWLPPDTLDPGRSYDATLRIRDGRRTILEVERTVELETSQPNGPGCPPTCHQGTVRVSADDVRAYRDRA